MLCLNFLTRGGCPLGPPLLAERPKSAFGYGWGKFCSIVPRILSGFELRTFRDVTHDAFPALYQFKGFTNCVTTVSLARCKVSGSNPMYAVHLYGQASSWGGHRISWPLKNSANILHDIDSCRKKEPLKSLMFVNRFFVDEVSNTKSNHSLTWWSGTCLVFWLEICRKTQT